MRLQATRTVTCPCLDLSVLRYHRVAALIKTWRGQLTLPAVPAYYRRMSGINVRGPRILGKLPELFPLTPREVWARTQRDGAAVDARAPHAYGASHIPRSYNIPFGESFGTWVGWLVDENTPLVFVWDDDTVKDELVRHLVRIGLDNLEGYLGGGMDAWEGKRLRGRGLWHLAPLRKMRGRQAMSMMRGLPIRNRPCFALQY